jgi:glycosyltransferase involved in cell wall biosynthesis
MLKISIITVAFNSANTIAETMQSVAIQDYPHIEHIIIDGASTDGTIDIVEKYAISSAIVKSEPDEGIYDAMNKGLAIATGDVVGFLNSDDVFNDAKSVSMISQAMCADDIDACYADLIYVSQANPSRVVRFWKSCTYKTGLCAQGWMPAHPTFYVRKTIYEKHGFFDHRLKLQADFEMALRLLEIHKIKTAYIPYVLVKMRTGGASNASIKNIIRGNLEASQACIQNGLPGGIIFIFKKIMSRVPQFISALTFKSKIDSN